MKKRLFAILLAMTLALSFVLVACGDDEQDPPEPTTYTVTFNLNGAPGTAPAAQTIEEGNKASKPTNPNWTGYVFGGWYTDAACTTEWTFTTDTVTKDTTLYAKWTVEQPSLTQYTVTFNLNGAPGTVPNVQNITEGETATEPTEPTWDDKHIFGGWFTDAACTNAYDFSTPVTGALVLYAKWTEVDEEILHPETVTYTVTFNLNGAEGTAPEAQTINEGETATEPAEPGWDGYNFTGWFTDEQCTTKWNFDSVVTGDLTLYAGWEDARETFTVTFHAGIGKFDNGEDTFVVEAKDGDVLDSDLISTPNAEGGYVFEDWYIDEACETEWGYAAITANIDIYANYIIQEYEVKFDIRGGYLPTDTTVPVLNKIYGESIPESDMITSPVKFAYDFTGWFIDEDCTTIWNHETDIVTSNITFYAGWTKKTNLGEQEDYVGRDGDQSSNLPAWMQSIPFVGTIDGEEVTFVVTGGNGNYDNKGNMIWTSHSKIECENHIVNIKNISGNNISVSIEAEIDGVAVTMSYYDSLELGYVLVISRPGYNNIELIYDI